jgi:hypothetical protein
MSNEITPLWLKVNWNDEAEIYGQEALEAWRIPKRRMALSHIVVTNTGTSTITICVGDDVVEEWAGLPLAGGDWEAPGQAWVFEGAAIRGNVQTIRAKVHGGWAGQVSLFII